MDTTPPVTRDLPKAVLFDLYGTLLDVYSVGLRAEQMYPGEGDRLARLWRDKQVEYSRLVSMSGRYRPFWQLTRDALQVAAATLRLPLDAAGTDSLMNEYRHLSAFPENRAVLQTLADRGIRTGVLSNGDPEMLAIAMRSAGLTDLIDPVLSVHATRRYKTDPAAYALGPVALGLAAPEILFVSSNCWDAIGAAWYGFTTLWVNRTDAPLEQLGIAPTRIGRSLRDVLEFF
ncbi:MAG: haloacid dehalogenase type II [Betaproteobacteria bacterium]